MSSPRGRKVLVLGGIGSGRSRYAESLLADAGTVRRLTGHAEADPSGLARALTEAKPDETLLVDGLDDWLAGRDAEAAPAASALVAGAVSDSTARLVLVSPEVGMSAPDPGAQDTAEAIGALNRAVAGAVDEVILVVAGQPVRLRGPGGDHRGDASPPAATVSPATVSPATVSPATVSAAGAVLDEARLKALSVPDEEAREAAAARLAGAGLGAPS
jgi:nicotinate-nucleotide--dimethylbenzimidazole phosphoribosyltransferase